jgi:hypothetical protein
LISVMTLKCAIPCNGRSNHRIWKKNNQCRRTCAPVFTPPSLFRWLATLLARATSSVDTYPPRRSAPTGTASPARVSTALASKRRSFAASVNPNRDNFNQNKARKFSKIEERRILCRYPAKTRKKE